MNKQQTMNQINNTKGENNMGNNIDTLTINMAKYTRGTANAIIVDQDFKRFICTTKMVASLQFDRIVEKLLSTLDLQLLQEEEPCDTVDLREVKYLKHSIVISVRKLLNSVLHEDIEEELIHEDDIIYNIPYFYCSDAIVTDAIVPISNDLFDKIFEKSNYSSELEICNELQYSVVPNCMQPLILLNLDNITDKLYGKLMVSNTLSSLITTAKIMTIAKVTAKTINNAFNEGNITGDSCDNIPSNVILEIKCESEQITSDDPKYVLKFNNGDKLKYQLCKPFNFSKLQETYDINLILDYIKNAI